VYRSGSVSHFTDIDRAYWQQLGLHWICDLRSEREVERSPDVMPAPSTEYIRLPMFTEKESTAGVRKFLLNMNNLQLALMHSYIQMLDDKGHIFGTIFRRLLQPDGLPGLFHCTAGKDRTGVTAMLLLGVLGVPDDLIVADYTLTNQFHHNLRAQLSANARGLRILRLSQDDLMPVLLAHPDTMRGTIAHLRQKYATYEGYLSTQAGISASDVACLRGLLLE
jgi:protein-tyrosine phosphatase